MKALSSDSTLFVIAHRLPVSRYAVLNLMWEVLPDRVKQGARASPLIGAYDRLNEAHFAASMT